MKALILDIDGVIIGDRQGINFPDPVPEVAAALKELSGSGVAVHMCTARPAFSISRMVREMSLDGLHIADNGAVITDPNTGEIPIKHVIPRAVATAIVRDLRETDAPVEIYETSISYLDRRDTGIITDIHAGILDQSPEIVDDLTEVAKGKELIKIIAFCDTIEKKETVGKALLPYAEHVNLAWTHHPATGDVQYAVITATGITKAAGAQYIAEKTGIPLAETVGVGDGVNDWDFMRLCGTVVAMGNSQEMLLQSVKERGDTGFVAPSVDENGMLWIIERFFPS
ncbi:MAG: HAD family hydrolase [archaeon]